jgi:uncharacterized protein YhfF
MIEPSTSLAAFWEARRFEDPTLPDQVPEAWAFGATANHADDLLDLVLRGIKDGTASSIWGYEATGNPLPEIGDLSVILDGSGEPRAVIEATGLRIVPFDQVDAEHARAEGEGDRSLEFWRAEHERFWREHADSPRGWAPNMPVLCERFRLRWPAGRPSDSRYVTSSSASDRHTARTIPRAQVIISASLGVGTTTT